MNTNSLVGIAAVALVIIGGFYLLGRDGTVPEIVVTETPTVIEQNTPIVVTYTDEGFEPGALTVKQGQSVRWVNNSSRPMWPASAFHPTHRGYPEKTEDDCLGSAFDACAEIAIGDSWEFIFNVLGTWRYHDHISVNRTGTVEVE